MLPVPVPVAKCNGQPSSPFPRAQKNKTEQKKRLLPRFRHNRRASTRREAVAQSGMVGKICAPETETPPFRNLYFVNYNLIMSRRRASPVFFVVLFCSSFQCLLCAGSGVMAPICTILVGFCFILRFFFIAQRGKEIIRREL